MSSVNSASTTVIVSVYKDTQSLAVVLDALAHQSVMGFEIIVSEDGCSKEMGQFLSALEAPEVIHLSQEDVGWRKNRALNNAIRKARGDYVVFLDGDCVPNRMFVEAHQRLALAGHYLLGRRVFLGPAYSARAKDTPGYLQDLQNAYLLKGWSLHRDGVRHFEDGITLPIHRFTHALATVVRGVPNIVGCHFSCFKDDLLAINGFDEDYQSPGAGEDEDLVWRFEALGLRPRSCRNFANVFHLDHAKRTSAEVSSQNREMMLQKARVGQFRCPNGIQKP